MITLSQLLKLAAAAPAPGGSMAVAPPPNPVSAPTVAPAGGAGAPMMVGSRYPRTAQQIRPSAPTGGSALHAGNPLTGAPPVAGGQPGIHNGMLLPQEQVELMQQQEAEAQAEAQKNQPKPQAAPKPQQLDTPFHDQMMENWSARLAQAAGPLGGGKKASDPAFQTPWSYPTGGTSRFNSGLPGGEVGTENQFPSTGMFPNSKLYGFAKKMLLGPLLNVQSRPAAVSEALSHPELEFSQHLARNMADPVHTGNTVNPLWQLGANFASSLMGQKPVDPGQIDQFIQQGQQALGQPSFS